MPESKQIPVAQASKDYAKIKLTGSKPRKRIHANVEIVIGCVLLGIIALMIIAAPLLTPYDPTHQSLREAMLGFSSDHPLGTDQFGRDIWARLLYGGRIDLFVAVMAVFTPLVIGTILGAIAGYFDGPVPVVIMRLADLVSSFPFYVLVIVLVFVLGNGGTSIFIAISAVSWVPYTRISRGETLVLRDREFIASCKTSGFSDGWVLFRHVIPNIASQGIVYAMSDIVINLGIIVTLSYFGLGIVPPTPDWGQMMNDGQQFLSAGIYSLTVIPTIVIVLISLALSFIGDGLANVLKVRR
ncbi:ABC transporter permease [Bifidobacterium simiarum]|nr:ABC transporter permease [Bifidobacterium simiarum]